MRIAAGALSKALPVTCGVKAFRYRADGPVDLDITAVIQAGELVVTSALPAQWLEKLENLKSTSHVSNELDSPPRHGRRGDEANVGRKVTVQHPRAAELHRIFDPALAHSGASLLSMASSQKFSQQACEAIQDCDHEYLARFVTNRGTIKSVAAVPLICADALASWKASLTDTRKGTIGKLPTREEIDAMVKKDLAELAEKKRRLRNAH
jgi:hypothetical protein